MKTCAYPPPTKSAMTLSGASGPICTSILVDTCRKLAEERLSATLEICRVQCLRAPLHQLLGLSRASPVPLFHRRTAASLAMRSKNLKQYRKLQSSAAARHSFPPSGCCCSAISPAKGNFTCQLQQYLQAHMGALVARRRIMPSSTAWLTQQPNPHSVSRSAPREEKTKDSAEIRSSTSVQPEALSWAIASVKTAAGLVVMASAAAASTRNTSLLCLWQ